MRIGVRGKIPLRGVYRPGGSSNAALILIAAALLTDQPVTLRGAPDTLSVAAMLEIAERLGARIAHDGDTVMLETPAITTRTLSREMTSAKVGAVMFAAAVLARRGYLHLEVDYPLNRLYTHLTALRDLGCRVTTTQQAAAESAVDVTYTPWERREIVLAQTSVTATALAAMLAAATPGETILRNAASEPQVQDLLALLIQMGVQVEGAGSNLLRIRGQTGLHGGTGQVGPDHIEAASVAAIAALSGGRLDIEGVRGADLRLIARVYARLGVRLDVDDDHVHVPRHESLHIADLGEEADLSVETAPWPGFPSDLAAVATLIATQSQGTVLIHEKLFDNRLLFVDKLKGFGAQIVLCDPHRAIVVGPTPLRADYLDTPDVRTGLALVGAALCAEGETVIDGAEQLDWNFEGVLEKLQALGAQMRVLER